MYCFWKKFQYLPAVETVFASMEIASHSIWLFVAGILSASPNLGYNGNCKETTSSTA